MTPQTEIKQAHEDFAHTGSSNLYDYMLFYLKVCIGVLVSLNLNSNKSYIFKTLGKNNPNHNPVDYFDILERCADSEFFFLENICPLGKRWYKLCGEENFHTLAFGLYLLLCGFKAY